jgi:hypothetical protein
LILLSIVLPAIVGVLVFRIATRFLQSKTSIAETDIVDKAGRPIFRIIVKVILAALLLTWLYGAPAVLSSTHGEAIQFYKKSVSGKTIGKDDRYPYVRTAVCFPILPGVLMSYHQYQIASLWGRGGWEVHVWYVTGVKRLFSFWIIVS